MMSVRFPEACRTLRRMLRGLPSAIYHIVTASNLQMSGCVHCGIGPHCTNDCPFLDKEVAESKAAALYRRWSALIGEELLIFSRSSTTAAYAEAATIRFSNRSDVPSRPPRRMKRNAGEVKQPMVLDPILPTPQISALAQQQQEHHVKPKSRPANPPVAFVPHQAPSVTAPASVGVKVPIAPPKAKAKSTSRKPAAAS